MWKQDSKAGHGFVAAMKRRLNARVVIKCLVTTIICIMLLGTLFSAAWHHVIHDYGLLRQPRKAYQQPAHDSSMGMGAGVSDGVNTILQAQATFDACPANPYSPHILTGKAKRSKAGRKQPLPEAFRDHQSSMKPDKGYFAGTLGGMYAGNPTSEPVLRFHWLITSSSRLHWGRTFSSTLISGLAGDLYPATISVLWNKPYNASDIPPLLYNLRHSHQVNIMYISDQLAATDAPHVMKLLVTALLAPCSLGMPDLPLLWTEDDIVFAPDVNARLYNAISWMSESALQEPFALSLYDPNGIAPAPELEEDIKQPADDIHGSGNAHTTTKQTLEPKYWFGLQGAFFSPSMVALLYDEFVKVVNGEVSMDTTDLQDTIIFTQIIRKWKCNKRGSSCRFFMVQPSLVQHIGSTSSFFNLGGRNPRFHTADDFPVRVRFVGYQNETEW